MRTKAFLWTLVGCLIAPSIATAQDVYFSTGNAIQKISYPSTTSSAVFSGTSLVGDLALCAGDPDVSATTASNKQYLYFVQRGSSGDQIARINVGQGNQSFATVTGPLAPLTFGSIGEIRLTESCDLVFTTSLGGVLKVDGTPTSPPSPPATPTQYLAAAGAGLAIAFDGSLRFSDANKIKTDGAGFDEVTVGTIIGLGIANGGAGSDVDLAALSLGAVCASTLNTLVCAPKGGDALTSPALATFSVTGSLAQYFEFLTDDTVIAATSVSPAAPIGGTNKYNGILWKVTSDGPEEILRADKQNGSYPPIVGVAVAQSSSDDATSVGTQHNVTFGPVAVDIVTPLPCTLKIKLVQLSWLEAKAKLNSVSSNQTNIYTRDPGLGGESWIDSVDVKEADDVLNNDCGLSAQTPAQVGLAQFNDPGPNKALLHCDGTDCSVTTFGNYPFFTVTDPRDSGTADDFSDFLTAQTQSDAKKIQFSSPLNNGAIVDGAIDPNDPDITSHNASGGLSIRFRICKNEACTQFENAEPANPTLSGAGFSLAAIDTNGDAVVCEIQDSGNSTPTRPVFRTSEKFHNFNVNTPPGGPPLCQMANLDPGQTQLYVATAFSYGGNFTKTSILFRLIK